MKRAWLQLIDATLNRVTSRAARRGGPFVLVRTVGRTSGRAYETPIIARRPAASWSSSPTAPR